MQILRGCFVASFFLITLAQAEVRVPVEIQARDAQEREAILNLGISISYIEGESVFSLVTRSELNRLRSERFSAAVVSSDELGGAPGFPEFPKDHSRYRTFPQTVQVLRDIERRHSNFAKVHIIGRTSGGRDILAIQFNSNLQDLNRGQSKKPGLVVVGKHHAREHLSSELTLRVIEAIAGGGQDPQIEKILKERDLWLIPQLNPDGGEFDISGAHFKGWRKNRARNSGSRHIGVDLNRNYSYQFGGKGASDRPSSDIYHGPKAFSELETQAFRDFVMARNNLSFVLSVHTFSELILYPWGYDDIEIGDRDDREIFRKLAVQMATFNGYRPMQSSQLYPASGTTSDWVYGEAFRLNEHGDPIPRYGFTFELTPKGGGIRGFYPGNTVIDATVKKNLPCVLLLADMANDPKRALREF